MNRFEDHLLDDLLREYGDQLAAVHRRPARKRPVLAIAGVAGVTGVAGVVALTVVVAGPGTPAYAVTGDPRGAITVSLQDISGVSGANAQLRKWGVPAVAVPMRADCTAVVTVDDRPVVGTGTGQVAGKADTASVTFTASMIPAGDTLVLGAQQSGKAVTMGMVLVRGQAPACLRPSLVTTGPAGTGRPQGGLDRGSDPAEPTTGVSGSGR